jgi:WD40 repeat protein
VTIAAPPVERTSPYKGLNPFTEQDADYFFGREGETRVIADNLLASRLTLLYGASGVGKSSLLAAGVTQRLAELPDAIVVTFPGTQGERRRKSWRDEPLDALLGAVHETIAERGFEVASAPERDLVAVLAHYTEALDVEILLILDQFEEYFLYHREPFTPGTLAQGLVGVLTNPLLAVNVLIAIRDDAYASLDHFKGRIPLLYDNYLRLAQLSLEHARDAIEKPLEKYNEFVAEAGQEMYPEPALIDEVLKQFLSVDVTLGPTGKGAIGQGSEANREGVEPPYLQLVMERLWDEERARGSQWLRKSTLDELGGAGDIVRTHLDAALSGLADKDAAAKVFGRLVTPSGTKIAQLASDLAESENLSLERVTGVLEPLAAERIVRPVAPAPGKTEVRWEIFHDVLAPAVLDWRARRRLTENLAEQERKRADAEQEIRRRRKTARALGALAGVALLAAIAAVIVALIAIDKENEASDANRRSEISNRVREATAALRSDPSQALSGVASAIAEEREQFGEVSDSAVAVLRQAVRSSSLAVVLNPHAGPVQKAIFTPDEIVTLADRRLDLWRPDDGTHLDGTSLDAKGRTVQIAGARGVVVAGTSDGEVFEWRPGTAARKLGKVDGTVSKLVVGPHRIVVVADARLYVPRAQGAMRAVADDVIAVDAHGQRFVSTTPTGLAVAGIDSPGHRTALAWPRKQKLRSSAAAFSGDGHVVVAAGRVTGGPSRSRFGPGSAAAAAPPPGVVRSSSPLTYLRAWDVRTGKPTGEMTRRRFVTSIAVDDTGKTAAAAASDGSAFRWRPSSNHAASLESFRELAGHTNLIGSIAFTPDGHWIVTGSGDGTARVWSAASGLSVATLLGHGDWVSSAGIDPAGTRIVTASDDGTARVWRFPAERPEVTFHMKPGVYRADLSADGRRLAVLGRYDSAARLVDTATGRTAHTIDKHAWDVSFGPGGRVLTAAPSHVAAWDADTGALVGRRIPGGIAGPPDLSADGGTALVPTLKGLRVWNVEDGVLRPALPKSRDAFDAAVSRDGRYAAATIGAHLIRVWDLQKGELVHKIKRDRDLWASAIALSPSGSVLVITEGLRGTALPVDGGPARVIGRSHAPVSTVRFSNDGKLLLTAGDENTARVWDVRTGTKLAALRGHTGHITTAKFSPDNRLVITGSEDGTARIWDARTGDVLDEVAQDSANRIDTVAFANDSRHFLASSTGTAAVYNCVACGSTHDLLQLADDRAVITAERPAP